MQSLESKVNLFLLLTCTFLVHAVARNWDICSGRLERALNTIHRDFIRRNYMEVEKSDLNYQHDLKSVPLEMKVSDISIKFSQNSRSMSDAVGSWAKVGQCVYMPNENTLYTRVIFNDLSVFGMISLIPRNHQASVFSESCRMILRLRKSGIEFFTTPVAYKKGQMKIQTESTFLKPRFLSIYAYGCHPNTRYAKQIEQKKMSPMYEQHHRLHNHNHGFRDKLIHLPISVSTDSFGSAEPQHLIRSSKGEEMSIGSGNAGQLQSDTKVPAMQMQTLWGDMSRSGHNKENSEDLNRTSNQMIPSHFITAANNRTVKKYGSNALNILKPNKSIQILNITNDTLLIKDTIATAEEEDSFRATKLNRDKKAPLERVATLKNSQQVVRESSSIKITDLSVSDTNSQSRQCITQEVEDIFLKSASQALTRYIEQQLHPAIKEILMLSMGYTMSYG